MILKQLTTDTYHIYKYIATLISLNRSLSYLRLSVFAKLHNCFDINPYQSWWTNWVSKSVLDKFINDWGGVEFDVIYKFTVSSDKAGRYPQKKFAAKNTKINYIHSLLNLTKKTNMVLCNIKITEHNLITIEC